MSMRADPVEFLTGGLSTNLYPSGISLPGQGGKFTTSGEVQQWSGNTFICHVRRPSDSYSSLLEIQDRVKRSEFSSLFSFLPAPSFHMTVFQGLSPGTQNSGDWPAGLPVDIDRDGASAIMLERLGQTMLDVPDTVRATDLYCAKSLTVAGVNDADETRLRQARTVLKTATQISPPDFDSYVFHITFGYLIQWLSDSTAHDLVAFSESLYDNYKSSLQRIELQPCTFCNFESMHAFTPVSQF